MSRHKENTNITKCQYVLLTLFVPPTIHEVEAVKGRRQHWGTPSLPPHSQQTGVIRAPLLCLLFRVIYCEILKSYSHMTIQYVDWSQQSTEWCYQSTYLLEQFPNLLLVMTIQHCEHVPILSQLKQQCVISATWKEISWQLTASTCTLSLLIGVHGVGCHLLLCYALSYPHRIKYFNTTEFKWAI